jgi:aminopeptidase N
MGLFTLFIEVLTMAWLDIGRELIDPYLVGSYSDDQKDSFLNIAAYKAILEDASYANGYAIAATGSAKNWSITPEPDDTFIDLVSLRAACIAYSKKIKDTANTAVSIKDGQSAIDKRSVTTALNNAYGNPCEDYENRLRQLNSNDYYITQYNFGDELNF